MLVAIFYLVFSIRAIEVVLNLSNVLHIRLWCMTAVFSQNRLETHLQANIADVQHANGFH